MIGVANIPSSGQPRQPLLESRVVWREDSVAPYLEVSQKYRAGKFPKASTHNIKTVETSCFLVDTSNQSDSTAPACTCGSHLLVELNMQKTTANYGKNQHAAARRSAPPLTQSPSRLAGLCVAALLSLPLATTCLAQVMPVLIEPIEGVDLCTECDGYVIRAYDDNPFTTQVVTMKRGWIMTAAPTQKTCAKWVFIAVGAGADINSAAYLWDAPYGDEVCSGEMTPSDLQKQGARNRSITWVLPCEPKPALFRFTAKARVQTTGRIDANDLWFHTTGCGGLWAAASTSFTFDYSVDPIRNRLGPNPWPGVRGATSTTAGSYCEGAVQMSAFAGTTGSGIAATWVWSGDVASQQLNVVVLPQGAPTPYAEWEVCAAIKHARIRAVGQVEYVMSAAGAHEVSGSAQVNTFPSPDHPVKVEILQTCSECTDPSHPNPGSSGGSQ
jgi:hypothetical protein